MSGRPRQSRPSSSASASNPHQEPDNPAESQLWRQTLDALSRLPRTQDASAHVRLRALVEEGLRGEAGRVGREKVGRQLLGEEEALDREIACVLALFSSLDLLELLQMLNYRPRTARQSLRRRARVALDPPRPTHDGLTARHAGQLDPPRRHRIHLGDPPRQAKPAAKNCHRLALVVHLADERAASACSNDGSGRRGRPASWSSGKLPADTRRPQRPARQARSKRTQSRARCPAAADRRPKGRLPRAGQADGRGGEQAGGDGRAPAGRRVDLGDRAEEYRPGRRAVRGCGRRHGVGRRVCSSSRWLCLEAPSS